MTNERAIEILEDLSAWLSQGKSLYWSASEISKAIVHTKVEIYSLFAATVLHDYVDWLEFGKPFYHSLSNLIDALDFTIETLKANQ